MAAVDRPKTFADFGGPNRTSGGQVVFQNCPVCGNRRWKVYVNPDTGFWFCHAPEHSGGGKVDCGLQLAGRGRAFLESLALQPSTKWHPMPLPAYEPLGRRALRYLMARGISERRAARLGIVEMQDRMRIVVPYYGPDGEVIYWSARAYSKMEDGPKYLAASGRHPLYVRPDWLPTRTLVLVEGVFDALAVEEHTGLDVCALGGKYLPRYLEHDLLRIGVRRLVVLLDPDALADAIKLRSRMMTKREVKIIPLPLGKDPADLGPDLEEILADEISRLSLGDDEPVRAEG